MKTQPTEKALAVLDFITQYYLDNYKAPSSREIAEAFDTSTSMVNYYTNQLVICGLVKKTPGISRGAVPVYIIEIFEKEKESING